MKKIIVIFISVIGVLPKMGRAQETALLAKKISALIADKKMEVGVAISSQDGAVEVSIKGDAHFPMQSVFKLPLALYAMAQIDAGRHALNEPVIITKAELLPDTWSPLREKYPGGTTMPLAKLIKYILVQSDNNGADILLKMLGGPHRVEDYMHSVGIEDIAIKVNEEEMHREWKAQFDNWITPKAANALLRTFYENENNLLCDESHRFIWKTLGQTQTGTRKIRGHLPKETAVAHKTGHSGANSKGITAADNDIGVVGLPDGTHFYISVFITDSEESPETHQELIADIAKCARDYLAQHRPKTR